MGTIYYIFDENGKIFSEDRTRRFTALEGMRLHEYMKTEESRKAYFLKTEDEMGNIVAVQMPQEMAKEYEEERKHSAYLRTFENAIQIVSLDSSTGEDNTDTLESFIADESEDIFANVCRKMEVEMLRRALKTLKSRELLVISTMFLGETLLSEREVSSIIAIPSMTVHDIKIRALKKLENFFEKNPCKTQKRSLPKG